MRHRTTFTCAHLIAVGKIGSGGLQEATSPNRCPLNHSEFYYSRNLPMSDATKAALDAAIEAHIADEHDDNTIMLRGYILQAAGNGVEDSKTAATTYSSPAATKAQSSPSAYSPSSTPTRTHHASGATMTNENWVLLLNALMPLAAFASGFFGFWFLIWYTKRIERQEREEQDRDRT
jgi:hypothetical protein